MTAQAMVVSEATVDETMPPSEFSARSVTAAVYQRRRKDIITCRLQQNEKLLIARLQEQFGVSLSVVRESLSRLVADGLVLAEIQRGFRVSKVSTKGLIDVTRTRIRIEGMALAMAIEHGNDQWLDSLHAVHDALKAVDRLTQTETWAALHGEFHRALLMPCDSAWLRRFRDLLFELHDAVRPPGSRPSRRNNARHQPAACGSVASIMRPVICLAAGFTTDSLAHSKLEEASPRAGAVLDAPPAEVRVRFNGALEPTFRTLRVMASSKAVPTARSVVDGDNKRSMSLVLPRFAAGVCDVQWAAVGHDGHRVTGSFQFTVK